jgi:hypothetical protein
MARLGAAIAVAALALGGCGGAGDEDAVRASVDAYIAALRAADADAVCARLTDAELADLDASGGCEGVFSAGFELYEEEGVVIPEYEIAAVEADGDSAEATLVGGSTEAVVPLAREDGEWKLAGSTALSDFHPDDPIP